MRKLFLILTLVTAVTACGGPTSPTPVVQPPPEPVLELPEIVLEGWEAAKGRFFAKGITCVEGREPSAVKWIFEDGTFDCGGVEANGCFWVTNHQPWIALNSKSLSITLAAHEISHYLLWACADPNQACYLWEKDNYSHPGEGCGEK
jgi:hypothetical protein